MKIPIFKKALTREPRSTIAALVMACAALSSGQTLDETAQPAVASGDGALSTQLVKTGLYLISGGGGNSLLRFSANGSVLVDGKLPGNYRALMSQIRKTSKLSDLPLRVLIVTDRHAHHTGNNAQFLTAGIPVIVQENARPYVVADHRSDGKPTTPVITFDRNYILRLGGVEVRIIHFGNAQTNDHAVVFFPDLKVVDVGDLFSAETPQPDFAAGGSLVDWGPVLDAVLKLDFDVVVPGRGPIAGRADLEAFKRKIDTVVSRGTALVNQGVAKDQLLAQLHTDDLGWQFSFSGEALDLFYADLSRRK